MLIRLAFVPAVISFLVLCGWLFNWPVVIAPLQGPPMTFNAALCLFILSLSILTKIFRPLRMKNAWVAPAILAALTGAQYIFYIDLAIDEVFVRGYLNPYLSHPGRMPVVTSFCLFLSSVGWGALSTRSRPPLILNLFSFSAFSAVLFLGSVALVNSIFLAPTNHSWQSFAYIPIHSAISFVCIGTIGLLQSIRSLSSEQGTRTPIYGTLSGLLAFFLTVLFWQYFLQVNSEQVSLNFRKEVSIRAEKLTHLLEEEAEEFQKMEIPESAALAKKENWKPSIPAHAVIRLKPKPQLIWAKEDSRIDRDVPLLNDQIADPKGFHFFANFYFQRSRWFAFSHQEKVLILSVMDRFSLYFPTALFDHSLVYKSQVVCSNVTGTDKILQQWKIDFPMHLWDSEFTLQISPTPELYTKLSSANPVHFVLAGAGFSLIAALTIIGMLHVWRRFSR